MTDPVLYPHTPDRHPGLSVGTDLPPGAVGSSFGTTSRQSEGGRRTGQDLSSGVWVESGVPVESSVSEEWSGSRPLTRLDVTGSTVSERTPRGPRVLLSVEE